MLVGLGAADGEQEALVRDLHDVAKGEADELGAAERGAEAEQQHGALAGHGGLAGAEGQGRGGTFGEHQAQQPGHRRGRLAARADALGAGDALEDHGEAGMAEVDRAAGEQVRGANGGQRHTDRADGATLVGETDDVHGDGVRIGAERFARERGAPGRVLLPGRAVGAAGAVAPGPGRVDRGAAGQLIELGGASDAGRDGEGAKQRGLEGERAVGRRAGGRSAAGERRIGRRGLRSR